MGAGRIAGITLAIVIVASWLSIAFYPSHHDYVPTNPGWNGVTDMATATKATFVDSIESVRGGGKGKVLLIMPDLALQDWETGDIKSFVSSGGTLLVLDNSTRGNQIAEALGAPVRFNGRPLLDPYVSYKNLSFPRVADFSDRIAAEGVKSIVLDHPTSLVLYGQAEVLATSSVTSYLAQDASGGIADKGPLPVAARAAVGQGTAFFVSDTGMVTNGSYGIEDNARFISALVATAGKDPGVFIDTSHLNLTSFDLMRQKWTRAAGALTNPYIQVLLIGGVLALTLAPVWRKGKDHA